MIYKLADAVQRGLIGEIIARFEKKGLKITAMKMVWPTKELAARHYDLPEETARALGGRFFRETEEPTQTGGFLCACK